MRVVAGRVVEASARQQPFLAVVAQARHYVARAHVNYEVQYVEVVQKSAL